MSIHFHFLIVWMTALLQFASTCICSLQHTAAETRATPLSRWKQNISIPKREDAHRKRHRLTPPVPSAIVAISSRFRHSTGGRRNRHRYNMISKAMVLMMMELSRKKACLSLRTNVSDRSFFLSTILILLHCFAMALGV